MLTRMTACCAALLYLAFSSTTALAQEAAKPYWPVYGMPGKDVLWAPAEAGMVNKVMELARVGPGDVVVDLGSGDGRTVIAAARHGAQGIGVEFNQDLVNLSRSFAKNAGVAARTRFIKQNLFDFDLGKASVITLFLTPVINMKLRPALLDLKPGTRVISIIFGMEDWQHDDSVRDESIPNCGAYCLAYLWVVPARVAGTWRLAHGEFRLEQRFQMVTGTLSAGGTSVPVSGRLRGDHITLTAADSVEFTGRVVGKEMGGTVRINGVGNGWHAVLAGGSIKPSTPTKEKRHAR